MSEYDMVDLDDLEKRMDGAISSMRTDFHSLRTGRASANMLDAVQVDAYGSMMPINQVATVNVPEPRMITVSVWDKGMVGAVEKAIREGGLGLNPVVDGATLRLPIPELNEERRKEMAKAAGQYAENARIAIRNVRRDGMDQVKKGKSDGMPEDEQKMFSDEVQQITDRKIGEVDLILEAKQTEIMQV